MLWEYGVSGSEDCVSVDEVKSQPFSVVLDSDDGVCCHHSSSYSISGFSTLRPAGKIRPAKPFHPVPKHVLPIIKTQYVYEKCVDLVECKVSDPRTVVQ